MVGELVLRYYLYGGLGWCGAWLCLPSTQLEQVICVLLRTVAGVSPGNVRVVCDLVLNAKHPAFERMWV